MFLLLTNRLHTKFSKGEKVLINFDKVISVRDGTEGAYLCLESDSFREFLCYESQEEISLLLDGRK
jgi:hypothetical protein